MAIVRMKKLRLMLPRSVRDELLAELQKAGCVEFSELEQVLAPEQAEALSREETDVLGLKGAQQEILTALAVLDRYSPQKTPLLAPKPERAADEFLSGDGLEEAGKTAFAIIEKENRIRQIAGEESRLRASREALLPWESLDLPLETEGTERCALLAGSFPAKVALSDVEQAVASVAQTAERFPVSQDKRE